VRKLPVINGGLDALIATVKRFQVLFIILLAVATYFVKSESDRKSTREMAAVGAASSLRNESELKWVSTYLRDSVMTIGDAKVIVRQMNGEQKLIWASIEKLQHKPVTHRDRPRYYPQYGPIPTKMTDWFEWYTGEGNEVHHHVEGG